MKSQAQVLEGTEIRTDDMPEYRFSKEDHDFLAVAEGFVQAEWDKVCEHVGFTAVADDMPPSYERMLQVQGRWTLEYGKIV